MIITVKRMFKFTDETKNIRAFCDVNFGGKITVNGCRLIMGKNGMFATLPQKKGKEEGKWDDIVKITDDNLYTEFKNAVIEYYNNSEQGQERGGDTSFEGGQQPASVSADNKPKDEFEE